MRAARPDELTENVVPVLRLRLSRKQFERFFPVRTVALDPLAAPEPSRGALIRLDSGSYIVVTYGEETQRAIIEVAQSANPSHVVSELLSEVSVSRSAIEWRRDSLDHPPEKVTVARPTRKLVKTTTRRIEKSVAPTIKKVRKSVKSVRKSADREMNQMHKSVQAARTALKDGLTATAKKIKKAAKAS